MDVLLESQPEISLDTSSHSADIRQYCEEASGEMQAKFGIPDSLKDLIVYRVTNEAQGMSLYAKLVMHNLQHQPRLPDLHRELGNEVFPRDIGKAYERVLSRILDQSVEAERNTALRVLTLVICAKRILYWREIQAIFCIDSDNGTVDYSERLYGSCKELCGSLLDFRHSTGMMAGPESTVGMVHHTAYEHLSRREEINTSLENAKYGILCLQYLTSEPFESTDHYYIMVNAKRGYFALQDYAVQCWYGHLLEWAEPSATVDPSVAQALARLGGLFLRSYSLISKVGEHFEEAMTPAELRLQSMRCQRMIGSETLT
ncbi:hypothetical protein MFIFM68171_08392 [Madurella fahalii]|uniref:Uncharacterized protein n=1 Tax=Madurella fahalii TaxID=1157608 RepID=A0ABQ0GK87_9PEZI